ncbi:PTS sugar transporter subunit IIA [Paraliobacillus zengyii]|uniref:PTS sugar transporter subunit IIA n=1 Tax=Paraliobacillus zengyii TaxID=2213194 RepID=UPI000DD3DE47|nr:PTS sugar transporter subunit IIA [Paraliobacillus zengyii]
MINKETYPIAQLIRDRRTIKKFKDKKTPVELITEILDTAVWAPTHRLREPWRFIAFIGDGRKKVVQLIKSESEKGKMGRPLKRAKLEYLLSIPCHIVIVMNEDPRTKVWEEDYAAVCALIQNFQLTAWERGLGVVWKTDEYISSPKFREGIDVVPGEKIVGLLQVGYPDAIPRYSKRIPATKKLTVIDRFMDKDKKDKFKLDINQSNVFFDLPDMSKTAAIQFAGEKLVELGYVGEAYVDSMHEKESMKSTYLGNGIATPHGSKSAKEAVVKSGIIIMHFRDGIDYEGEKVHLMVGIAAERQYHLDVLLKVSTMFEDIKNSEKVFAASSLKEFINLFEKVDEESDLF